MASLEGSKIKDTYGSLLKVTDNGELESAAQEITDGAGNASGISLNNQGDLAATGTVSFGSLKDSGEDITVTKFVDEADGISSNDNDTSIPTSAAVKDYVDSYVTAQDLDITDGTNNGSIDLDSQVLLFTGDAGVSATVSNQEVILDSSALQAQITSNDTDISALDTRLTTAETNIVSNDSDISVLQADLAAESATRLSADNTLQTNIDTASTTLQSNIDVEESARIASDATLQTNIDTETSNRISGDAALQSSLDDEISARLAEHTAIQDSIDAEAVARAAEDTLLHAEIDTEISDRAAADVTLQSNIDAEETARIAADTTLQNNITAEASARTSADTTLQSNIDAEAADRATADSALQGQITSNDSDISGLDTRLTAAEGNIISNDTDISALDGRLTTAESNITSNDGDISALDTRLTTAETNISGNDTDIAALDTRLTTAESNITSNDSDISGLDSRLTTAESDITSLGTSKQSVSEKGQANGYASLDSNGLVPTSQLPESVTGALIFEGLWDASTNTPTLPDPTLHKGDYYKVSVEGTYLGTLFHVGDWALSDGIAWEHIHTQETVSDVFGRTGSISAIEADYSAFYPLLSDLAATDANVLANTTKLAGIEAGADVTDATNVAAAGALMSGTAVLNDLADVSGTPTDGQVLTYDSVNGWQPEAAASAPVTSVNTQTGDVVLDADDIDDSATTNKFTTAAEISKLAGIEAGADVTDAANVTTALGSISVTAHSDVTSAGSGAIITSAERTKLNGIEAGADVTDTANVVAALTAGSNITIGVDGTISSTDTNTTYTAGSGLTLAGTSFSHSDTSSAANLSASGRRYVTGLTFDTYGHVTGYTTGTETVVDTNTTYSAGTGLTLSGTTFSHADTSTLEGTYGSTADGTKIDTITIDANGHITDITTGACGDIKGVTAGTGLSGGGTSGTVTLNLSHLGIQNLADPNADRIAFWDDSAGTFAWLSAGSNISISGTTISATDTNTTYSAGGGLSLSGTTFSHSDTSAAANLAASGRRYVTGLTFDTYGHVTGYTTGTETVVDTNTTYSAGSGLSLSGTTFSLQSDLRGEAWLIGRDNNDYIHVNTTMIDFVLDGNVDARIYNNGDFHADGNIIGYSTSISDQKFKDDVTPIESALDKVKALNGVEYTWNMGRREGQRDLGFIAQEVEKVVPEIVREVILSTGEFNNNAEPSKTVDYTRITAILVEAMKEQQQQIEELKAKLDGITN